MRGPEDGSTAAAVRQAGGPQEIDRLARCAAVPLPADPPRRSRVAFWQPDGSAPPAPPPAGRPTSDEQLTVALPDASGAVRARAVPAVVLPLWDALPVLAHAHAAEPRAGDGARGAAAYWGAATVLALRLGARGRLLPGLSPAGHDAWRFGGLDEEEDRLLRELAAAMPPLAHATPLPGAGRLLLPAPEGLLRAFLDAVADTLPRTPAAVHASGHPAFAAPGTSGAPPSPELRRWAAALAAAGDPGVRLSLRVEVNGLADGEAGGPRFRAVVQLHSRSRPGAVVDAAQLWSSGAGRTGRTDDVAAAFGPRAHAETLLTLRRAAAAWPVLSALLSAAVPDAVDLADDEVAELLSPRIAGALAAAGVEVHWPRRLLRRATARAVVGPPRGGATPGGTAGPPQAAPPAAALSADALLSFDWRLAVGDEELTRAEVDTLARSGRALARLRGEWVLLDPEVVRRVSGHRDGEVSAAEGLGAVLAGTVEDTGGRAEVRAAGWLAPLRARLADPEPAADTPPVRQPAELAATLRDYQLRGLDWLHRMTSLGLGACLADDMGLGKTVTLIALHLHRQTLPQAAGPTLVVCPASLLGNWQREIERFAPGTPVRRYHGPLRHLRDLAAGAFVLTTYGTMRLDADALADPPGGPWGLVVADEAQHVKNPRSATAKRLRTVPARARVALTGTPVENDLSELWAILDWTTPGVLGRLGTFRRRYADAVEQGTNPAAADRLARLVRPFLLRRRKSDPGVAPELPPRTETDHPVALTAEQAGLYEAVVREGLAEAARSGGFARKGAVLRLLTALKQVCNHPAQYLKEEGTPLAGRSGKLELLDELLDTVLAGEAAGGVLVFTQYVRMARLLERHLAGRGVPTLFLHGGTPVARREGMVQAFQSGAVPVFLLSLKAAGTGLNLTRAEHVVHFDRWWNPAVEAQATDRAHRIGQRRPVQVHRLVAEGTVEDRIAALLQRKQELADAVLASGEAALTELSDRELADLVELRRDTP